MPGSAETFIRLESLSGELTKAIVHYRLRARRCYLATLLLMVVTLIASITAGVGGLFLGLDGKSTGAIALAPGLLALVAGVLKPQQRANWYYRKKAALSSLRRRLLYEMPEAPSSDNIAAISSDWTVLDKSMNSEWEKRFSLDWNLFVKPNEQ